MSSLNPDGAVYVPDGTPEDTSELFPRPQNAVLLQLMVILNLISL